MSVIAVITARGGSKRIPKKNIRPFNGRPIIEYSVKAALESGIFDEVMVSTDSEEIKAIAEAAGASVPFLRSAETSSDTATTADVLREVLENYAAEGKRFSEMCCLYPTAPFVTADKLVNAHKILLESAADAVMPVVQFSFPPQRAFIVRDGNVAFQYPEYERARSQDLEPIYHDCGQFYMCKSDKFLEKHSLILPKTRPYILPEEEVQDIDTQSDWEIAEAKYSVLHKGE